MPSTVRHRWPRSCRLAAYALAAIWYWLGTGFLADVHRYLHEMPQATGACCSLAGRPVPDRGQPPRGCDPQTCALGALLQTPAILWQSPCQLTGAALPPAALLLAAPSPTSLIRAHIETCRGPPVPG